MKLPTKKFYLLTLYLSVLLFAVSATNCRNQEEKISVNSQLQQTIQIGLIPEHDLFKQKKRYKPLAAYLSKKIGIKVELQVLCAYGGVIDNFIALGLEGAFFGSFTAALAYEKLGIEALARPEYADGTSTYHGLIFVRKDSGIKNAADMRGKRFVFVDKATTAGCLLPLYYFKTNSIEDYSSFFKETYFAGTHEGAISDVLGKMADIGAAKNTVFYREANTDPRILNELVILAKSPDVPANGLCVRKSLAAPIKYKLKEALLDMDRDEEGKEALKILGAARFIETTKEDYKPVYEYAAQIGLDLKNYDYSSE